jgi:hypothetical protein
MEHILKNWPNFLRFLLGLFIIFLLVWIIVDKISDNTEFNVDFSTDKTLITLIDKKNVIANSVLPACDCWTNTGIEIRPDEEYEIKVSGKIHTTVDKMVKDADDDIQPRFPWIGPEGDKNFRIRDDKKYRLSDSLRQTLLLNKKANLGQVMFYIQKTSIKPSCNLNSNFFIPETLEIYDAEKGLKGKNDSNSKWYIWATVNDMLLRNFSDPNNKIAYLGGASGDTLARKLLQWEKLSMENYNKIWFDDNFGNFVISAKIEKPRPFWSF